MGLYIAIAVLAGGTALWAVNIRHHNFTGVWWQLVAIAVLARAFIVGRRSISTDRFAGDRASGVFITETESSSIAAHDEEGRTPVERMFNSK
jgi:hypothetical protein